MPLYLGNSTSVTHTVTNPLQDPIYVNDATVTITILDSTGAEIPDEFWPVQLPYVSGSNGVYQKTFEPFNSLVAGQVYTVIINTIGSDGLIGECKSYEKATNKSCSN